MSRRRLFLALLCMTVTVGPPAGAQRIRVVNMIPRSLSHEHEENSEPSVTVNPVDPSFVVGTAYTIYTNNYCDKAHSPAFVSSDSGETWSLLCVLPTPSTLLTQKRSPALDMTVRFSGDGTALYAGFMMVDQSNDTTLLGTDAHIVGYLAPVPNSLAPVFSRATLGAGVPIASPLLLRRSVDQPFLATAPNPSRAIAIGADDDYMLNFSTCYSGSVYYSLDVWPVNGVAGAGQINPYCVAFRPSAGRTPAVRTAIASDGYVYAVFYRPIGNGNIVDVVVARNDPPILTLGLAFQGLKDRGSLLLGSKSDSSKKLGCVQRDSLPGFRVKPCALYPTPTSSNFSNFGNERRIRSELSIAVSPTNPAQLYIAWADSVPGSVAHLTLHFARSPDHGASWTIVPFAVDSATNPALAVAADGAVGILYQHLASLNGEARWEVCFALSTDGLASRPACTKLADTPALTPAVEAQPYLGDYLTLESRGRNFFGIFSASNDLSHSTFWPDFGVQRLYGADKVPVDLQGKPVPISIDPYFVRVIR
ncbi:MAG: hypothetical protein ABJE47_20540 [bacterium]